MTTVSTMGQANEQIQRLQTMQLQLATLQTQLNTGKKTQIYKGLGTDVITSERARANVKGLAAFDNNIAIASRRLTLMDNALSKTRDMAEEVLNAMEIQTQEGEYEMESVSDLAKKARDFIAELINQQDGDRYLFGGTDPLNQPLTDPGSLDTYMRQQLDDWVNGVITTDQLITSYRDSSALNDTTIGYSATLSSGAAKNTFIRVDETTEIEYGVRANSDPLRDIMVAISMIENMGGAIDKVSLDTNDPTTLVTAPGADQAEKNENFYKMFNDVTQMLGQALKSMEREQFSVSQSLATVNQIKDNHLLEKNILEGQIADVENVDINEVAVKITGLTTLLEASYSLTASMQNLSLVNYLR